MSARESRSMSKAVIRTRHSFIKHRIVAQAIMAQIGKAALMLGGRAILIDGNAGDGEGIELPQFDMFDESTSRPTPKLLIDAAADHGFDVVLCENNRKRRAELAARFPTAIVIGNHSKAIDHISDEHAYALWVSDPCGPAGHGVDHMRRLAELVPCSDFVIVFNQTASYRIRGTHKPATDRWTRANQTSRGLYNWMADPNEWAAVLDRQHIAATPVTTQSTGFCFRVLVISNSLANGASRRPFEVIK